MALKAPKVTPPFPFGQNDDAKRADRGCQTAVVSARDGLFHLLITAVLQPFRGTPKGQEYSSC